LCVTPSGKTSFGDYHQMLYCESLDFLCFARPHSFSR